MNATLFYLITWSFLILSCRVSCVARGDGRECERIGYRRIIWNHLSTVQGFSQAFGIRTVEYHEQPRVVESGQAEFADEELHFFRTIGEAADAEFPNVVLLSSVLQYVQNPYDLIREVCSIGARSIVVARTPCALAERDILTVQVVPPSIYKASYPCWIFAESKLLEAFSARYRLVASFQEPGGSLWSDQGPFELRGFILDRKSSEC